MSVVLLIALGTRPYTRYYNWALFIVRFQRVVLQIYTFSPHAPVSALVNPFCQLFECVPFLVSFRPCFACYISPGAPALALHCLQHTQHITGLQCV